MHEYPVAPRSKSGSFESRRQAMSYSISTLLTRNLHDVFGENDPGVGARPSTRSTLKIACSTIPGGASTVAATRSIASRARSGLRILTFDTSQLLDPGNWATAGGSHWDQAAPGRRPRPPGLHSSSPWAAALAPPFSFLRAHPAA